VMHQLRALLVGCVLLCPQHTASKKGDEESLTFEEKNGCSVKESTPKKMQFYCLRGRMAFCEKQYKWEILVIFFELVIHCKQIRKVGIGMRNRVIPATAACILKVSILASSEHVRSANYRGLAKQHLGCPMNNHTQKFEAKKLN
jgi:hypothetical protein